jgi:hypothetical protein
MAASFGKTVAHKNRHRRHTGEGRYPFPVAYDFTNQAAAAFFFSSLQWRGRQKE